MSFNPLQTLQNNIRAIEIALNWQRGDQLSQADSTSLKNYAGFGGIKSVLYGEESLEEWVKLGASQADQRLHPMMMDLYELLHKHFEQSQYKEVVDSLKNSVLTSYYTPKFIPEQLYTALSNQGISPKQIYEPSAGAGVFVGAAASAFPDAERRFAVERDLL